MFFRAVEMFLLLKRANADITIDASLPAKFCKDERENIRLALIYILTLRYDVTSNTTQPAASFMSKLKRVTLQQIADTVGVTKMTVSRYLRHPDTVAAPTGARISAAIDTLGYIQNRAPSMLSRASSKAIGIVIPSLSNQVFSALVQGIESVTRENGYDTLLAHTGYDEQEEQHRIAALLSYQIDGIILTETHHTHKTRQMLMQAGIPIVESMELPASPLDMAVGLDHQEAAKQATQRLLTNGCRAPVYFAARMDTRTLLRQAGYEQAMDEAGLDPVTIEMAGASDFSAGRRIMAKAMSVYPAMDGALCTNDDLAVGALFWCRDQQVPVPEQMRIIGYNGLDIGQAVSPALTSVITPRYQIGEISARYLLDAINGNRSGAVRHDVGFSFTNGSTG